MDSSLLIETLSVLNDRGGDEIDFQGRGMFDCSYADTLDLLLTQRATPNLWQINLL